MNNWLVGETSLNNLQQVSRVFRERRIKEAESFFSISGVKYSPFISSPSNYEFHSIENVRPLLYPDEYTDKIAMLKIKEGLYTQIPSVGKSKYLSRDSHLYPNSLEELELIEKEFETAVTTIEGILPWMGKQFNMLVSEICPIVKVNSLRTDSGLSDFRLLGCIFMSVRPEPDALTKLMVSLAHELGHQAIFFYQSGQDLFLDSYKDRRVYSSIRQTQRSIYGSFQGCMAFAYMGLVSKKIIEENIVFLNLPFCQKLMVKFGKGLAKGLSVFRPEMMTPLGKRLYSDLVEIRNFLDQ